MSETTTATGSSKVTFQHCLKLKGAYTGPSEMLEFISSACIHNNVRRHTELFEKSSKINERKTHSKPTTEILENLCNYSIFVKKGEGNFFWRKVPVSKLAVYLFANPFSAQASR